MFTGIVEEMGIVRGIVRGRYSAALDIQARTVLEGTKTGDSIAVNGICLTVTSLPAGGFTADVMHETLDRSALLGLRRGTHVNLERAMPAAGRYGGHIVAGHADGVGTITRIRRDDTAGALPIYLDGAGRTGDPALHRGERFRYNRRHQPDGCKDRYGFVFRFRNPSYAACHRFRGTPRGGQCQSGNGYHCKISGKAGTSSRRIHSESAAEYCYCGIFVTSRFLEQFKEAKRMFEFDTVEEALEELKKGKIILVTDDPERENEGDFICAAEFATTANINFMATHGRGLICMPMSEAYVRKLKIPQMAEQNTDNHETAFTVSIDHVTTTTGISAAERSVTAMKCVEDDAKPEDFRRPGHMFPLLARTNGVLERNGHTEAVVDLCRLAGRNHDAHSRALGTGEEMGNEIYNYPGFAALP